MRSLRALAIVLAMMTPLLAFGREPPIKDSRDGAFQSELIAIVSHTEGDAYRLEEVFLKPNDALAPDAAEAGESLGVGDAISLPGFELYSYDAWGFGHDRVEHPITSDTRILLFLKRKEGDARTWEVAGYGYCFFWVDDPSNLDQLRREATTAVTLRTDWEEAAAIDDPRARVAALWPFLWNTGSTCFRVTLDEFAKAGEVAGDFVAERFPYFSSSERMSLMTSFGRFGGDKLHDVLVSHLESLRNLYPSYLPGAEADVALSKDELRAKTTVRREMSGELYYGAAGLAHFKRTSDLPFIRDLGVWAAKYGLGQTCEAVLSALQHMPNEQNVPLIEAIWREFNARAYEYNNLFPHAVTNALIAHRSRESIAVLTRLLDDPNAGENAHSSLIQIVGEDLGRNPQPWLDWAAQHLTSTTENGSPD
ncbi:MAG: hypothetical protein JW889_16405 [Verrucomicrobia bacterium]|nr:hypothetical protein [Verrucomicrobiota bacterium]